MPEELKFMTIEGKRCVLLPTLEHRYKKKAVQMEGQAENIMRMMRVHQQKFDAHDIGSISEDTIGNNGRGFIASFRMSEPIAEIWVDVPMVD